MIVGDVRDDGEDSLELIRSEERIVELLRIVEKLGYVKGGRMDGVDFFVCQGCGGLRGTAHGDLCWIFHPNGEPK